jgi:pescadillo protein
MYYQSEVLGEPITWLMPHAFTQALPREVDFRVMITFLEFYEVFVKFVLFKLYHSKGWQYPPVIDKKLDAEGCCLLSLKSEDVANSSTKAVQNGETQDALVESKSKKADDKDVQEIDLSMIKKSSKGNDEADDDSDDDFDISVPLQAAFSDLQNFSDEGNQADQEEEKRIFQQKAESDSNQDETNVQLFSKLVFFINREVPLGWLQLCITAFGGRIGWDGPLSPISVDDARITHHIIDRPIQGKTLLSREYIQPQWVFDCINAKILLPVRLYAPGTTLPPHLSPFVDDEKQGYMPRYREEIKKLQSQSKGAIEDGNTVNTESNDELEESDIDEEEENADKNKKDAKKPVSKKRKEVESEDEEDSDDREDEEEESEAEEVEDVDFSKSKKGPKGVVYQKIREATEVRADFTLSLQLFSH